MLKIYIAITVHVLLTLSIATTDKHVFTLELQ